MKFAVEISLVITDAIKFILDFIAVLRNYRKLYKTHYETNFHNNDCGHATFLCEL